MARIRSVHPSLFTDEAWVSCSPLARLLYIGLWTDADDQGLFEWKPLQIKMRLLPGDTADVAALLAELASVNLVAELQAGGRRLGAIRSFRRFQRPKKPNSTFVLPSEWANYVGLGGDDSEPDEDKQASVRNQFPTEPEKSPQMEDGGGVGSSVSNETGAEPPSEGVSSRDPLAGLRSLEPKMGAWRLALRVLMDRGGYSEARARPIVGKWAKDAAPDLLWQASEAAWEAGTLDPVPYITAALERIAQDTSSNQILTPSEVRQRAWMAEWAQSPNSWRPERGPRPGELGCRVAPQILSEFGLSEGRAA